MADETIKRLEQENKELRQRIEQLERKLDALADAIRPRPTRDPNQQRLNDRRFDPHVLDSLDGF